MTFIKFESEKLIERVKKETGTNYQTIGNLISVEDVEPMIEDLLVEIDRIKEQLDDEIEQKENYYRPLTVYEEIGIKENEL